MRQLPGVLILLLAVAPLAAAQGPTPTSIAISGAGPVLDLTETATKSVSLQVQFTAQQGFVCAQDTTFTVDVAVTTTGPITATLDNTTLTYTLTGPFGPLQPFKGDAFTLLTLTKTGAHEEAEATVTATYAGASTGCVPADFEGSNESVPVRTTALGSNVPPSITIVSPSAGSEAGQFEMRVNVFNFDLKPVPTSPGVVAGQGHVHYLVDGKPAEGEYATAAKNFTFKGLAAGDHTLRAELVNNDHTALSPPVFAEVTVKATGASPTPTTRPATTTPTGTTPTTTTPTEQAEEKGLPGPGLLAVGLAGVAAALVLRRRG